MRSFGLKGAALWYYLLITGSGLAVFGTSLVDLSPAMVGIYAAWVFLIFLADFKLRVAFHASSITVSCTLMVAAYVLFDVHTAVFTAALGSLLADLLDRRGTMKAVFNSAQVTISVYAAGLVFYALKSSDVIFNLRADLIAVIFSYFTYTVLNTLMVLIMVSLFERLKFTSVLRKDMSIEPIHLPTVLPIALLIVYLYQEEPLTLVFLAIPLVMAHNSFKNYTQLHTEAIQTLQVLADIVDRRDPYTASHSKRVAALARETGRAMGLNSDVVEQISMAGRVHDIGKVSVPDRILLKPGQLTKDEYEVMKSHAKAGYDILSGLKLYKKCARYVLYHHEHINGRGYPEGLRGEAIPIGARVLAVADAYDAMTSDRPYRKALTKEAALAELERHSGVQFDPEVIGVFCAIQRKETEDRK